MSSSAFQSRNIRGFESGSVSVYLGLPEMPSYVVDQTVLPARRTARIAASFSRGALYWP
jgi:hypothetical protein